jgi:surface protein
LRAVGDCDPNAVITNYAFNPNSPPPVEPGAIDWTIIRDHRGYDQAYTQGISAQYNGTATPEHIVFNDKTIDFYGYASQPYYDVLFSDVYASWSGAFILRPKNMNFHSFRQTGYLFNGSMTYTGSKYEYTGFALILECQNTAGMQENDPNADNKAALNCYYLDHEVWDTDKGSDNWYSDTSAPGATRRLVAAVKSGIRNMSTDPFRVSVETTPNSGAFKVSVNGALIVDASDADAAGYRGANPHAGGFGFFASYYSHGCDILTRIAYEHLDFDLEQTSGQTALATVRFVDDANPNDRIHLTDTEQGMSGQRYRVCQPRIISDGTYDWILTNNDYNGDPLTDISRIYSPIEANNITTLRYIKTPGIPPSKTARINGGEWKSGSGADPVDVAPGDEIEYKITVYRTLQGPMLTSGNQYNAINSAWFLQPNPGTVGTSPAISVQKGQVTDVTFVDLPDNYSDAQAFFGAQTDGKWGGADILKAWDATDTSAYNKYLNLKVYCWVTDDGSGNYKLFIGGNGGVWMTGSPNATFLFAAFDSLYEIHNIHNFHTDTALNMTTMFGYCKELSTLDLSGFDTSKVNNMDEMFANCASL